MPTKRIKTKGWALSRPRECDICHEPYWRRNLTEIWDQRNAGHRAGWHKTKLRMCMRCFTIELALRVTSVIAAPMGATKKAEKQLTFLRDQVNKLSPPDIKQLPEPTTPKISTDPITEQHTPQSSLENFALRSRGE